MASKVQLGLFCWDVCYARSVRAGECPVPIVNGTHCREARMTMPGFKSQRRSRSAEPRGVEAVPSGSAPVPGWFPGPVTQGRTVTPPDTVAAAKDGQVFAALRRSTAG